MGLVVPSFGGGVSLVGSPDAKRTDELLECDMFDIGERGQLVATSDFSALADTAGTDIDAIDAGSGRLSEIWGVSMYPLSAALGGSRIVAVGTGPDGAYSIFTRMFGAVGTTIHANLAETLQAGRVCVTFASLPFIDTHLAAQSFPLLVNLGARRTGTVKSVGVPLNSEPGLYVVRPPSIDAVPQPISKFDALGTGALSTGHFGGTKGKQLYFRGIFGYSNHIFGYGFDNNDPNGEGPNRLMFSNLGLPQMWGNDLTGGAADRDYTDSDAFTIGAQGTQIRVGTVWAAKAWIGTNAGLYYVEGYGRESFLTNGSLPIRKSSDVIGPHCLIEGPDGLLHGVGSDGHFIFDGAQTDRVGGRLFSSDFRSNGWWDLIWADPSRADGYPGKTNQDLVWMLAVGKPTWQVWIVVPFCDATAGYGPGSDSVIIKYNTQTGGYSRQVFPNTILAAGTFIDRDIDRVESIGCARIAAGQPNLKRYGYRASGAVGPTICGTTTVALPSATFGEYAPFGPDGVGVLRKMYLTVSWDPPNPFTLPLIFLITPYVDGEAGTPVRLTIGPNPFGVSPFVDGDHWVDVSGTDPNLGNGTAGSFTPSHPADFVLFRRVVSWGKWVYVPGMGQQGTRVTVPIAFTPMRGTRVKFRIETTVAIARYQIESIGFDPATIRSSA